MCGIVGLHLRNPELYPRLGELLTGMLCEMADRGSDSAGVAVYGDPIWSPPGRGCVSLLDVDRRRRRRRPRPSVRRSAADVDVRPIGATYLLSADVDVRGAAGRGRGRRTPARWSPDSAPTWPCSRASGTRATRPTRGGWPRRQGWQGVGHTRMATESAVTPSGCHPYAVGPETVPGAQRLVRQPRHHPPRTACRRCAISTARTTPRWARASSPSSWPTGRDVETALKELCATFDGFYTLLVSNRDSFAVVRDAIACKPAVIAETADWVAMGSEYRALAGLPGVETRGDLGARTGGGLRMDRRQ